MKILNIDFCQKLLASLLVAGFSLSAVADMQALDPSAKYSPLKQINRDNVARLELAWEYHTGDNPNEAMFTSFQDRPSLIDGNLVVCSINRRVIALDPATGKQRWSFDDVGEVSFYRKCRGVAHWVDSTLDEGAFCRSRIFVATLDNRLIALDGPSGKVCSDFGDKGQVAVPTDKPMQTPSELIINSPPQVVNDVVVLGSFVADNQRVDMPSGRVMAYDARSGRFMWDFDPIPRDPADPAMKSWQNGTDNIGAANVWTDMAADEQLDLVYLPTSSPSVDFYGGDRPGDNHYGTSIVALRGATGELVWQQQLVHHNVFDFDLPSQPMLIDFPHEGKLVPALVQNTKMGLIFVFNRETGEPLVPIVERPAPQTGKVDGEQLSPTQPYPEGMPTLMRQGFSPDDAWGFTFIDKWLCRKKVESYNYGPTFMPASEKGTIMFPPPGGGPNWGTGAYDPDSKIMVVPSNRVAMVITMLRKDESAADVKEEMKVETTKGPMVFANEGAPYKAQVEPLMSPLGAPCSEPPWAALSAVDMAKKELVWEVPLGDIRKLAPIPIPVELGTPGAGGLLATAGGLVFIGYTLDDMFRAFDLQSGKVLWEAELPAAGMGVPVTYEINGEQYIVLAAGGHSMYGSTMGDAVVAYKLKQ